MVYNLLVNNFHYLEIVIINCYLLILIVSTITIKFKIKKIKIIH